MRPLAWGAGLVAALFALALPAVAAAEGAGFVAASADGSHVFFRTEAPLVAEDTDDAVDVYERAGREIRLVAVGPNFDGGAAAEIQQVSPDGSLVVFRTAVPLVAADPDGAEDCYARLGGTTTRLSICPTAISETGNRLIYITTIPFTFFDTDGAVDVYTQTVGQPLPVLATPGTTRAVSDVRLSDDANAVVFASDEALAPGATPGVYSIFRTVAGTGFYELISGGSETSDLKDISADATTVVFFTDEGIDPSDTDDSYDLYARGPAGLSFINSNLLARTARVSRLGDVVLFSTARQLAGIDNDGGIDLYLFEDGRYTLVGGDLTGDARRSVGLAGASDDLRTVALSTPEPLVQGDRDRERDVYLWKAGSFKLITTGPLAPPSTRIRFEGLSADGEHAYLSTAARLLPADHDTSPDVYQRLAGELRLVTSDRGSTAPPVGARLRSFARSRDLAYFQTAQDLVPGDRDHEGDVYRRVGKKLQLVSPNTPTPARAYGAVGTLPGRNGKIVYSCRRRCDGDPPGIYSIRPSGAGQRRLIDDRRASDPVFSPDGRLIAFESDRTGNPEIYVIDAEGGDLRRVTRNPANDVSPEWLPDGRIAFSSDRDGDFDIWSVRVDRSGLRNIAESIGAVSGRGGPIVEARCVPGGTCDLVSVPRTGHGGERPVTAGDAEDFSPDVSPKGGLVAFERVPGPGVDEPDRIYVVRTTGADPHPITGIDDPYAAEPVFSPDGRSLLVELGGSLAIVDLRDRSTEVLVESGARQADWGRR